VIDAYVGSSLYEVIDEHRLGLTLATALALYLWWRVRRGTWTLWRDDPVRAQVVGGALMFSALIHLGLVLGHEPSGYSPVYLGGTLLPTYALWRLRSGRRWLRTARITFTVLIIGYAVVSISEPPDSVGLTTKLIELTGLAAALRPEIDRGRRALGASLVTGLVAVVISLGGWIGAFAAGDGGHHLGETPPPGVLLPPGQDRDPTAAELANARELYRDTVRALAPYEDPDYAVAHGYDLTGLAGIDHHADNVAKRHDGHILDPDHPETLVYAVAASGKPVLLGAMFQMDEVGQLGPAVGGPLTVWHGHDHICFGAPGMLAGLTSPFGLCPLGAITMPVTNEMLHVWTVPGLDEENWFGDIPEEWLADHLADR
jgi:hypothetical protein